MWHVYLLLERNDVVEVVSEKETEIGIVREIGKDLTGGGAEVETVNEKDLGPGRQDRRTEKNREKKSMCQSNIV